MGTHSDYTSGGKGSTSEEKCPSRGFEKRGGSQTIPGICQKQKEESTGESPYHHSRGGVARKEPVLPRKG